MLQYKASPFVKQGFIYFGSLPRTSLFTDFVINGHVSTNTLLVGVMKNYTRVVALDFRFMGSKPVLIIKALTVKKSSS